MQRAILLGSLAFLLLGLVLPLGSVFMAGINPAALGLLLTSPRFWDCLLNSLNLALLCTLLCTIIALPLALLTSRHRLPLHNLIQAALLLPMLLPPFVGAIGMRKLLSRFGPLNLLLMELGITDTPIDFLGATGLPGVALLQALHLYPILYLALTAAINRLDPSLHEAATISGAAPLATLRRITLPLLAPALAGGGILVFTWSLTDLGTPLVFDYRALLSVRIFEQIDDIGNNPLGYTLVVTLTLLCALLFALSKILQGSAVIAGGSKGSQQATLYPLPPIPKLLASTAVFVFIGIATLPHLGVALLSIAPAWFMTILPQQITLTSYAVLLSHPLTAPSIYNSVLLSLASTALNLLLGISIAWLLARGTIRGRRALDILAMSPLAIPGIVIAFGYLGAFSGTILDPRLNPLPLLALGYAVRRLPFMLRTVDAGFAQCERSLEEAAATFGASPGVVIRRITAPLLAPQLVAGSILCFCLAMLEVSESLILASQEKYFPISKAMYSLLSRPDGAAIASALGIATMGVILLGFLVAARLLKRPLAEILRP